jgi:putative DNA primase/helicase
MGGRRRLIGDLLLVEESLWFLNRGFSVVPLKPGAKKPLIKWEQYQKRKPTEEEVREWWRKWPEANIGIVCGRVSGLVVIDHDEYRGVKLPDGWDPGSEPTPLVKTPRAGWHYYYRLPNDPDFPTRSFDYKGIEIKADGKYVVAPPSLADYIDETTGKQIQGSWEWALSLANQPPADLPDCLIELMLANSRQMISTTPKIGDTIPKGERNITLASVAGSLRRRGLKEPAIDAEIQRVNHNLCKPRLPIREVKSIAKSISKYPMAPEVLNLTDVGNAQRLIQRHGHNLRYCHLWRKWLIWDGIRWVPDETGRIKFLAKETVRSIYAEAEQVQDERLRKDLAGYAIRSESVQKVEAMVKLAESERGIPVLPDYLDIAPWLLNVLNGTLDLKTGLLHEHDSEDLMTKLAPVEYGPDYKAPLWESFLEKIMDGNENLIRFLQRAVGYALTGDTSEQVIFILYGTGANGKTTFLQAISAMMGEYALHTPTETLLMKRQGSIPNDIARLRGARFVCAAEAEEGRRFAESLIKQLTGGDTISARFLNQEYFEFEPLFKIFLGTNHKPVIKGTDHAIWRRIRLIPFNIKIPDEDQDKELLGKLKRELPGILNWVLKGCMAWQRDGLGVPEEVKQATAGYREEMDVIAGFIADRCIEDPGAYVAVKDLYKAYKEWCEQGGERALTKRSFGTRLREMGFVSGRGTGGAHQWRGINVT